MKEESTALWAIMARSSESSARGTRVLVVDDEEDVAAVLARALAYAGYLVTIATNGQEAIVRLREQAFDVLLSDIYMPVLRGDELLRQALECNPNLAALMMTAIGDTSRAVECLKMGAIDFLLKPFDISDVLIRVEKALERKQLEKENQKYREFLEQRVREKSELLRRTMHNSLEALIQVLEAKDPYTQNHSMRVADMATALVERLYPGNKALSAKIRVAAIFHDIGKVGIPEEVLRKPGRLTDEERELVARHPVIGETILAPILDAEIVTIVRHHHEHWDGKGYPDALAGERIPLGARIVAVADAYDALRSPRSYRAPLSREEALQILAEGAGQQWAPDVVTALLAMESDAACGVPGAGHGLAMPLDRLADVLIDTGDEARQVARRVAAERTGSRLGVVLDMRGRSSQQLREDLEEVLREHSGVDVGLDLSGCALGSGLVQVAYALDLHARRLGGGVVFINASETVLQQFADAGLLEALRFDVPREKLLAA